MLIVFLCVIKCSVTPAHVEHKMHSQHISSKHCQVMAQPVYFNNDTNYIDRHPHGVNFWE